MIILKIALKEIFRKKTFSALFCINLMFGYFGFILVDSYRTTIENKIETTSRNTLGADLALVSRNSIGSDYIVRVDRILAEIENSVVESTHLTEFFSMGSFGGQSRLIQVKAIEDGFPFYGTIELEDKGFVSSEFCEKVLSPNKIVIGRELRDQWGLVAGNEIKIGNKLFPIADIIENDINFGFRGFAAAPVVYVRAKDLEGLGLTSDQSLKTNVLLFKTKKKLAPLFYKNLDENIDSETKIVTPYKLSEQTQRASSILSDFMSLGSLTGVFLSLIGLSFLIHILLEDRKNFESLLKILGLSKKKVQLIFLSEIILLTFLGIFLSSIAFFLGRFFFSNFGLQGQSFNIEFFPGPFVKSSLIGLTFSTLIYFCLLNIRSAKKFIRSSLEPILMILIFIGISIYQTSSVRTGIGFTATMIVTFSIVAGVSNILVKSLSYLRFHFWGYRQQVLLLTRKRFTSVLSFTVLAFSITLINLLPQVQSSLVKELTNQPNQPGLFIFDIQEEQFASLKELISKENFKIMSYSSMIRAKILKVNGKVFADLIDNQGSFKTREDEQSARFKNRGFNLTLKENLIDQGEIIDGKDFKKDETIEISIEEKFAQRVGLKMNDEVEFDIQGFSVTAKVTSFRQVKWESFQPNFFIVFETGAIDDAPKTIVMTVSDDTAILKANLTNKITNTFGNLSVIDVADTISKVLGFLKQAIFSIQLVALMSFIIGSLVFIMIRLFQLEDSINSYLLFKIIGCSGRNIFKMLTLEMLLLGGGAFLIGSMISVLPIAVVLKWFFDKNPTVDFMILLEISLFVFTFLILNLIYSFSSILKRNTQSLIGQGSV